MFSPPVTFQTARLSLRPPTEADAPAALAAYAGDSEVTRFLSWKHYREPEPLAEFFRDRAIDREKHGTHFAWLLRLRESEEMIGTIGCMPDGGKVVFGYALGKKFWGLGFATEALRAVVDWTMEQPGIYRAWAFCDLENPASARVMEKAGLAREAILRRWHVCPNLGPEPRDCFVHARVK